MRHPSSYQCIAYIFLSYTGITFPSGEIQEQLLNELYAEAEVDPNAVIYLETHGTGTKAGDPQEMNTIAKVFCGYTRDGPLLIGSTKSNMGHPEPASGMLKYRHIIIHPLLCIISM